MEINHKTDALIVIDVQNDFAKNDAHYDGQLYVKDAEKIISPIVNMCFKFQNVFLTQDWHPKHHLSFAANHENKKPFDVIEMYGHPQTLWPNHCVIDSFGADFVTALKETGIVDRACQIIRKGMNPLIDSYSAFRENFGPDGNRMTTGFGAMLHARGIKRLFICGLARDYCVKFSCLDAAAEGFEVYILDDLTKSVANAEYIKWTVTEFLYANGVNLISGADID